MSTLRAATPDALAALRHDDLVLGEDDVPDPGASLGVCVELGEVRHRAGARGEEDVRDR